MHMSGRFALFIEIHFLTDVFIHVEQPFGDECFPIAAGDELTIYKEDGTTRRKLGIFIAEKPKKTGG